MTRQKLPDRRLQITSNVTFEDFFGNPMIFEISFGFDRAKVLRECFIATKTHPMLPLLNDICVLISRLLQHGDTIESIAQGLGEDRKEGEAFGKPSSFIGAIARQGVTIQQDILHARS